MTPSLTEQVMELVRELGVARPRDLAGRGVHRTYLHRLASRGVLERVGRGLYRVAGADASERQSLAEASKRVPQGVICLLSALQFHGLTTQNPFEVWIAIDVKARRPKLEYPPLRVVRFSGPALTEGVTTQDVDGVSVRVYSAAKTVADCFKYRNKIGLDVALEALQAYRRQRSSMDELWRCAEVCRVAKVMRPYLEATLSAIQIMKLPAGEREALLADAAALARNEYVTNSELTGFEALGEKDLHDETPPDGPDREGGNAA